MDAVQQDTFATLGLAEEGEGEDRRALRAERGGGDGGVGSAHQRFWAEAPTSLFATLPHCIERRNFVFSYADPSGRGEDNECYGCAQVPGC